MTKNLATNYICSHCWRYNSGFLLIEGSLQTCRNRHVMTMVMCHDICHTSSSLSFMGVPLFTHFTCFSPCVASNSNYGMFFCWLKILWLPKYEHRYYGGLCILWLLINYYTAFRSVSRYVLDLSFIVSTYTACRCVNMYVEVLPSVFYYYYYINLFLKYHWHKQWQWGHSLHGSLL